MEQAQRLQRIPPYPFREIAALKAKMIEEGNEPIDFGIGGRSVAAEKLDAWTKETPEKATKKRS